MAVGDSVDSTLESISKDKKLTAAIKAQRKAACIKHHEKKKARYKQLLVQNKINLGELTLGAMVDSLDAALNWNLDDYRELDGMVRLINKSKAALPSLASGKFDSAEWKAYGEKMQVKLTPIFTKLVANLSPVTTQIDIDEKNGKFK